MCEWVPGQPARYDQHIGPIAGLQKWVSHFKVWSSSIVSWWWEPLLVLSVGFWISPDGVMYEGTSKMSTKNTTWKTPAQTREKLHANKHIFDIIDRNTNCLKIIDSIIDIGKKVIIAGKIKTGIIFLMWEILLHSHDPLGRFSSKLQNKEVILKSHLTSY